MANLRTTVKARCVIMFFEFCQLAHVRDYLDPDKNEGGSPPAQLERGGSECGRGRVRPAAYRYKMHVYLIEII